MPALGAGGGGCDDMEINIDCIRDILKTVNQMDRDFMLDELKDTLLPDYTDNEINIAVEALFEEDLVVGQNIWANSVPVYVELHRLSMDGMELLSKISDDNKWDRVRSGILQEGIKISLPYLIKYVFKFL